MNNKHLWLPLPGKRRRVSSWDRSGGNADYVMYAPHEEKVILSISGVPGCIKRMWFTLNTEDPDYLVNTKFNFCFDGLTTVSKISVGMLLATGPWAVNNIRSAFINVMRSPKMNNQQDETGFGSFNLCLEMPYCDSAEITVNNDSDNELMNHFYIDYQEGIDFASEPFLFHATHNRMLYTSPAVNEASIANSDENIDGSSQEPKNLTNEFNYLFADIENFKGNYIGTFLVVESHPDRPGKWYEGDDMFVVDGDKWPPTLHGTGTEDYFGMAWGIHRQYQAFDHGVTHYQRKITDHDRFYDGRFGLYRWHINDPINFSKSLHVSFEAGHANDCQQYYESVAYWYGKRI